VTRLGPLETPHRSEFTSSGMAIFSIGAMIRSGASRETGRRRSLPNGRGPIAARCKLEQSALPVETIAEECGLGNTERMRRTFQRLFEVSPHDYRARFRSTLLN
jgi:hypothetical protein